MDNLHPVEDALKNTLQMQYTIKEQKEEIKEEGRVYLLMFVLTVRMDFTTMVHYVQVRICLDIYTSVP